MKSKGRNRIRHDDSLQRRIGKDISSLTPKHSMRSSAINHCRAFRPASLGGAYDCRAAAYQIVDDDCYLAHHFTDNCIAADNSLTAIFLQERAMDRITERMTERLSKFLCPLDASSVRGNNDNIPIADKRQEVIHKELRGFEMVRRNPPGILIGRQIVHI